MSVAGRLAQVRARIDGAARSVGLRKQPRSTTAKLSSSETVGSRWSLRGFFPPVPGSRAMRLPLRSFGFSTWMSATSGKSMVWLCSDAW